MALSDPDNSADAPATPAPAIVAVSDSDLRTAGGAECALAGEDCSLSTCCKDAGQQCFRKNKWWAGCKTSCTPGVDKTDPPDAQTPWECALLDGVSSSTAQVPAPQLQSSSAGSKVSSETKEIVIELTGPPIGLRDGVEVTIDGGGNSELTSGSRLRLASRASFEGSWLAILLVCEGIVALLALAVAAWYWLESRRKAKALEAANRGGVGQASPGVASPGTLEKGSRPSGSRLAAGTGSPGTPNGNHSSPIARPRGTHPPSPGQQPMQGSPSDRNAFGQS